MMRLECIVILFQGSEVSTEDTFKPIRRHFCLVQKVFYNSDIIGKTEDF